jgi:hypothetical protein
MNEEYLWDKSGEPDPEIQRLEQILGTFRYQPKSLALPNDLHTGRRKSYLPLLAIAATLAIALLAGILWLNTRNKNVVPLHEAQTNPPSAPSISPVPPSENIRAAAADNSRENAAIGSRAGNRHRDALASNLRHRNTSGFSNLNKDEREKALEAKEQLMVALRLASEKLNLAQRKAQGLAPNQIRNQHKVG